MNIPTTTNSSSIQPSSSQETRSYCERRWAEALDRCDSDLEPDDLQLIKQYQGPDELLKNLSQLEQSYRQHPLPAFIHKVEPSLKPLKSFTTAIALSTRSRFIETALIWGFINLLFQLAIDSEQILNNIINMILELGHNLDLLEIYQSLFTDDANMDEILVDVFAEVVIFAATAIRYLRTHPTENLALRSWPNMNKGFQQTCESIHRQMRYIKEKTEALNLKKLVDRHTPPVLDTIAKLNLSGNGAAASATEATTLPYHYLPFRGIPNFFGRSEILKQIGSYLDYDDAESKLRKLAIWGWAGAGKSQTAFRYAQDCSTRGIQFVAWIQSEDDLQLAEAFSQIAVDMKLAKVEDSTAHAENRYRVLKWLADTRAKWLICFDNVEDPSLLIDYMPQTRQGSILITCRSISVADQLSAQILNLPPFTKPEGAGLLLALLNHSVTGGNEEEAGEELSELLGGLPLALNMMGSQIRTRYMNIKKFIPFYKANYQGLHGSSKTSSALYYQNTLATIWRFSFTALQSEASLLLAILSHLAPDSIPETLFTADNLAKNQLQMPLPKFLQSSWELSETSQDLIDKMLITKDPDLSLYFVHRLIQTEFRDRLGSEEFVRSFTIASELLYHVFPQQVEALPLRKKWTQCKALIQHVLALSNAYSKAHLKSANVPEFKNFTKLLANAAWYLHETNAWTTCIDLIETAFKNCQDLESLPYASLCNIAGCIFSERAQMTRAGDFYNRSLVIREKLLPPNHGDLADLYNNLGCLYLAIEDTEKASTYLDKAYEITQSKPENEREQSIHLRHLNLSSLYEVLQQYDKAKSECEQARRAATKYFGVESHFVASADAHLGNILYHEGDYTGSIRVYDNALRVYKSEMTTQPAVSSVVYRLARSCLSQGDVPRAIELLEEALAICKLNERLKGDEGESARVMRKLADALTRAGQHEEGERMMEEADRIRRKIQGAQYNNMPDVDKTWDTMVDIIFR